MPKSRFVNYQRLKISLLKFGVKKFNVDEWGESLDLIQELVEKATPKKGVWKCDNFGDGTLCCPNCKKPIVNVWSKADYKPNYCHYCGQALDWRDK